MNLFEFLTWVLSGFWRFVGFAALLSIATAIFPLWSRTTTKIERDGDGA